MIYWGLGVSVWVLGERVGLREVDLERLLLGCFEGVLIRIDWGWRSLGSIAYVSLLLQVRRKDSMSILELRLPSWIFQSEMRGRTQRS